VGTHDRSRKLLLGGRYVTTSTNADTGSVLFSSRTWHAIPPMGIILVTSRRPESPVPTNDYNRTADFTPPSESPRLDPDVTTPGPDCTTDLPSGSHSTDDATHLPSQRAQSALQSVSVTGYEIESVIGRGGIGVV
jgi:hypothetical protein